MSCTILTVCNAEENNLSATSIAQCYLKGTLSVQVWYMYDKRKIEYVYTVFKPNLRVNNIFLDALVYFVSFDQPTTMATVVYVPSSPLHLPNTFLCIPLEIFTLDVRLIYKRSSITTTVITIASTMMVMTTLEAMAAVFVDA